MKKEIRRNEQQNAKVRAGWNFALETDADGRGALHLGEGGLLRSQDGVRPCVASSQQRGLGTRARETRYVGKHHTPHRVGERRQSVSHWPMRMDCV